MKPGLRSVAFTLLVLLPILLLWGGQLYFDPGRRVIDGPVLVQRTFTDGQA